MKTTTPAPVNPLLHRAPRLRPLHESALSALGAGLVAGLVIAAGLKVILLWPVLRQIPIDEITRRIFS